MADIGYIALLLALIASVYAAIAFIFGVRGKHPSLVASAKNSLLAAFGLVTISIGALLYALITHDFQIAYVASYTSSDLSLPYLISALWAGNDGSLLLWAWLLSLCAVMVLLQKRDIGKDLVPYAASIIMVTQAFFLIMLLVTANPFHELAFVPVEGSGLNPLLEHMGMIIHPPIILAGYVALTIPFAFAMAALLTARLNDEWIITIRRWTIVAWLLLGVGNLIGAWWAYVELGWGGYWAWDPVENAGFMPWLVVTAFLHSIMMQRRRGMLKVWNMVLIIMTFTLSIFGTFLVRSGVLSSVHTFADSAMGPFFLTFIGITLFGSLSLLYYRSDELKSEAEMESLVSRESTFLLNNLLLVGAAFAIFLGTVFPLITEWVRGVKITVGPPFFNQVNGPIFLAIILLTGICALIGWRRTSTKHLRRNFLFPLTATLILGIVLFIAGVRQWYALVSILLCAFVLFTILYEWFRGTKARHRMKSENYLKAFGNLIWANRPRYGGYIVHVGMMFIVIGVVGSSFYDVSKEALLLPGESMTIESDLFNNNYTLTFDNIDSYQTADKDVVIATLSVYLNDKPIGQLVPEKYFHRTYEQPVTEVARRATMIEDLYVILVGWESDGTTAFKVLVNPLIQWIWIGGWVLLAGGLIALWPDRRRPPALKAPKTGGK